MLSFPLYSEKLRFFSRKTFKEKMPPNRTIYNMNNISLNKKMIKREKIMIDISLGTMMMVLIVTIIWLIVRLVRGA